MKRYWKLVTIGLVVILAIAVFYLQPVFAKDQHPEFTFKTTTGDSVELSDLTLYASYSPTQFMIDGGVISYAGESLTLTEKGSYYDSQHSLFEKLSIYSSDNQLQNLQKKYKHFMRGKDLDPINFFEDDTFLAYVAIDDSNLHTSAKKTIFDIQVLNKNSKEVLTYSIDAPIKGAEDYVLLQKVQVVDSALKVVTRNGFSTDRKEEFHIYHLDLGNKKVLKDEILSFKPEEPSSVQYEISLLNRTSIGQVENELIFQGAYGEPIDEKKSEENLEYYPEILKNEFFIYNIKTNTTKKIPVPEEFSENDTTAAVEGNTLYLSRLTKYAINLYAIALDNSDKNSTYRIDLPADSGYYSEWLQIKDAKFYLITPAKDSQTKKELMIYDLNSSNILYQGVIEKTAGNKDQTTDGLYIYDGSIN